MAREIDRRCREPATPVVCYKSNVMTSVPTQDEQREFWDSWNSQNRTRGIDPFMQRQLDVALTWMPKGSPRILEVGCGTGWLSAKMLPFGEVVGTDLSPQSIAEAQRAYPGVSFVACDFAALPISGKFDFVVSADTIAHVPDQRAFIDKIAGLMNPGGLFVLMTQNPYIWHRSSYLQPQGKGQIRSWPSLSKIRTMLKGEFNIVHQSSIVPGGDTGLLLRIAHSYKLKTLLKLAFGEERLTRIYERLLVGRELVVVARRR